MSTYRLENFFVPHSVAVIGASPRERSVGRAILRNLRSFPGDVHLVNPRYHEIDGVRTVKSYQKLEAVPDLAVVAVPPAMVPDTVAAIAAKGTPGAIIVTAGLGHGAGSLAERCAAIARASGLRLIGPNCLGVLVPGAGLNASFAASNPRAGDLALISQSGAIAAGLVEWAATHGVGFSAMVSIGDAIDVDFGDLLDYFAMDRATRAILLYVESINDARKFMSAARAAARIKPVIVIKAGRQAQGAKAARPIPARWPARMRFTTPRSAAPACCACSISTNCSPPPKRSGGWRLCRQAAGDPDQWRRHRRARGRSPRRSRRRARGHFARDHDQTRCSAAADLVAGQSGRHRRRRRRRPLRRGAGGFARRPRQ